MRESLVTRIHVAVCLILMGLTAVGCQKKTAAPAGPGAGMQGLPVQTATVALSPVAQSSEYVATIKSRRSATILPQVSGMLTQILVHSGDHVKAGQTLMTIDPRQQEAAVSEKRATERQKKALYDYTSVEVERQHKLFDAGVTSRDTYEQAQQAFQNAKADYEVGGGVAQDAGGTACLLHDPRAIRRSGRRYSCARGRLRFTSRFVGDADHRG